MEDKTQEFLKQCKEAGYEKVTIFAKDKRVPRTMTIKAGSWFGNVPRPEDLPNTPINVVCGYPERIDDKGFPKMWAIVKECGLSLQGFGGMGDAYSIHPHLHGLLTSGYYDLETTY